MALRKKSQQKITDAQIIDGIEQGMMLKDIAAKHGVSISTVGVRWKAIEADRRALAPAHTEKAMESIWAVTQSAEANYQRLLALLDECEGQDEQLAVLRELRQHLAMAADILERLYAINEIKSFMESLLKVLDECDPALRSRVLVRFNEQRALRSVLLPA